MSLEKDLKICSNCLYSSSHAYPILFSNDLCSGCLVHKEKDAGQWVDRSEHLKSQIVKHNSVFNSNKSFDCIIPVTGAGDSFFTVHYVKNILKLNPLLVNYNHHHNTSTGIRNLSKLASFMDCDLVQDTLSPGKVKGITELTIKESGSIYWQALAGMSVLPLKLALRYKIPTIIWGVHGWSDQVGMFSHFDNIEMTERIRREYFLSGFDADRLKSLTSNQRTRNSLDWFKYPNKYDIRKSGIRGFYLSNYVRWDAKSQHELMIDTYDYETRLSERSFNSYEEAHCHHSLGFHDYLKLLKFGYSRVVDHASRDIRLGHISRNEGLSLVEKHIDKVPNDISIFEEWIGMDSNEIIERNVSLRSKYAKQFFNKKNLLKFEKQKYLSSLGGVISNTADNLYTNTQLPFKDNDISDRLIMGRVYTDGRSYGAVTEAKGNHNTLIKKYMYMSKMGLRE
jgi:N-acetyl sugar amidotransferase